MSKYKFKSYGYRSSSKSSSSKHKKDSKKKTYSNNDINDTILDIGDNFKKLFSDCRACFSKRMTRTVYKKRPNKSNKELKIGFVALCTFIILGSIISFPVAICLCLVGGAIYLHN